MLKVVDLSYYYHDDIFSPGILLEKYEHSHGYLEYMKGRVSFEAIRHINFTGKEIIKGITFTCFRRKNSRAQIPWKTHKYIRNLQPDIIIIHGFIFPLQLLALKLMLKKNCKLILQHHGELPALSLTRIFQKIADRFVDAYTFTSLDIAARWLEQGIIENRNKCYEVLEGSVRIEKLDRNKCKEKSGLQGCSNFLWVGRLDANKDPLTVVNAFAKYLELNPLAKMIMIYQTEELLSDIQFVLSNNNKLKNGLLMVGKQSKSQLAVWYNAADYFVSGSHHESCGFALLEAIHCGCIPIVTNIPSFKKITGNGRYALLFEAGNECELLEQFMKTECIDTESLSGSIVKYASADLQFKNIADQLLNIFSQLNIKQR